LMLVDAIAREYDIAVGGTFGAVGAMLEKFQSGAPCDVVILTRAQVADLAAKGAVLAETVANVGAVATSIAVRAADAPPNIANAAALKEALLAADAIYFPDPAKATAGIHFAKVLDELRIKAYVEARLRTFPNGATAMREMAAAKGKPIGCTQATEILSTPGIVVAAPLPPGCALATTYTCAVTGHAAAPQEAASLIALLTRDADRDARRRLGFS